MTLTGIEVYNGATKCATLSGSLAAATESSTITCVVNADDGIYMVDTDGNNDDSSDIGFDENSKAWVIDGVCWNDGSGTDSECNTLSDTMIQAGVWGLNDYVNDIGSGIELISNGNNDEAFDDWKAIPEFSTLMMPIASVLMIIGYNYRKRNNLEA